MDTNQNEATTRPAVACRGKHLSNIFDHRKPEAESLMCHDHKDFMSGHHEMHQAWLRYLEWINENVIGSPAPTEHYTQAQLEAMGMIGIYDFVGRVS